MENLLLCFLSVAPLIVIYQGLLLLLYFTTITFGKQLLQSRSWNKYYDPIITFLLIGFFVVTVLLTQNLYKNMDSQDYSMLLYILLILLVNTLFSILFFGRKKLIQIKSKEQIEDEKVKQEKKGKMESIERRNFKLKESDLEEKKTIHKKLLDLEKSNIERVSQLNLKADSNMNDNVLLKKNLDVLSKILLRDSKYRSCEENPKLVDAKIIRQDLEDIIKTNSDEIIKSLKPTKSVKANASIINYKDCFSEKQLSFLWNKLRKYNIIHEDCLEEEFKKSFLINKINLKMDSISLYWFHKEINKLKLGLVSLTSFVTYFKNEQNKNFVEGTVRNGKKTPEHKLVDIFKVIFNDFPL